MKILSIARKTLVELFREPLLLGILFLFPIFLIGIYYIAFGETEQGMAKYLTVDILNLDSGDKSLELIKEIESAKFEEKPLFDLRVWSEPTLSEIAIQENKISLLMVIPPNFSTIMSAAMNGQILPEPATITLMGKTTSPMFIMAKSMLETPLRTYINRNLGWKDEVLKISYEFVAGTGTMTDINFGVAGIIVFGIMFVAVTTAQILVRENANGNLHRLKLTKAKSSDILLGTFLTQMFIAVVSVPIIFAAAVVFGFRANGSLFLAMLIALLLSLSAIGMGLLAACFVSDEGSAANLSGVIMVFSVLLSGAIYPMPSVPIFQIGQHTFQIYDFLPTSHAGEAMRRVLILGNGFSDILYELAMMTILSVITLAIGIFLYQKLQLRKI